MPHWHSLGFRFAKPFEREKDFTVTSQTLSTSFSNFRKISWQIDHRRDFRLPVGLGDEGHHTKSPHQGQHQYEEFVWKFLARLDQKKHRWTQMDGWKP